MGAELFVVDDGWFSGRIIDNGGLGDWKVDKEKFPNGLTPLIEHTHRLGMQFGLWVEPEMVNPNSDLYRLHPDWVYHFQGRERSEVRNQLVLNLARSDVQEYLFDCLDGLLSEYNISYIKWDMNRYFSEPGWPGLPANKQKENWIRHVIAIYELWERLQKKHPHVAFESCAGGGGRVDLGIMRYAHQFWISDNTDPLDRLTIQEGYTYAPNWVNGRTASLEYRFHSAMTGALGIGLNLNQVSSSDLEICREMILQYKSIRDIIQEGDLYRLHSPREAFYSVALYVSKDKSRGALFIFLHSQKFNNQLPPIRLNGLDEHAVYKISETQETLSGSALMHRGIKHTLTGDLSSKLITFAREH
jgi:alpha-galactosidase